MSNMTYFADGRRVEVDMVLETAGHTVRLGGFETRPSSGPVTLFGSRSQPELARKRSKRVQTGEPTNNPLQVSNLQRQPSTDSNSLAWAYGLIEPIRMPVPVALLDRFGIFANPRRDMP